MFRILFFLMAGIGTGYLLRHRNISRYAGFVSRVAVISLLFVFGVSIGADSKLISSLPRFGVQAAALALLGIAGSLIVAGVVHHLLTTRKGGAK